MPFKLMGKSPLMKKLVGNQHRLPEHLKAKIKAAPESPNKLVGRLSTGLSALSKATGFDEYRKKNRQAAIERDLRQGYDTEATRALKKSKDQAAKGATERTKKLTGAATANQNAGQTMQQQMGKVKNMSQSKKDSVKKMKSQLTGGKKTEVKKTTSGSGTQKPPTAGKLYKGSSFTSNLSKSNLKMPSTSGSLKVPSSTSKSGGKAINRGSSFTDEFGTTFTRDVKGRKKSDGSVSKTVTNKRDGVNVSQRDVFKGPKVKGKRKSKTVVRTKFDRKGDVRKVVEKTRGDKRKVLTDKEAKKRTEQLKEMRKKRDESPSKMKTKTPSKIMKKSPNKMMKKKSPNMMMKKKKSPTMMMKKKSSMKMMKKKK
jgi:hypothetical protein